MKDDKVKAQIKAALNRKAWRTFDEVKLGLDNAKQNNFAPGAQQQLIDALSKHLATVVASDSYHRHALNPEPSLSDADIDAAIAYAQRMVGEEPGQANSVIVDPRRPRP